MSDDLFRHNRPFSQLDGFFTEWSKHLTEHCLPSLRAFPTDAVLRDIGSYYDTLNHYANKDTILYLIFPSWRSNSLETSILFLGDIHPRLFITLVQSFIDDRDGLNQDPIHTFSNLAAALSLELGNTINGTVSRLLGEIKEAQEGFIRRFSDKWVSSFLPSLSGTVVMKTSTSVTTEDDGAMMIMEELVRIFGEANQLRKDTITRIVGALNMNQTALFLESVCKILAGFKHQDQAFQNSLLDNHLISQQIPKDDDHEVLQPMMQQQQQQHDAHQNDPQPMMMQQHDAPRRPPPPPNNHHLVRPNFAPSGFFFPRRQIIHPHMMPPPLPPAFYQFFLRPFAHPGMMQPFEPQRPPPPMMRPHQQHHVIYVGNLAPGATYKLLYYRFRWYYHSAVAAKICRDQGSGSTYGFVSFADETEKMHAMQEMDQKMFLGRPMCIGPAAKNSI